MYAVKKIFFFTLLLIALIVQGCKEESSTPHQALPERKI